MKIWIVTYEINAYDQEGEYFHSAHKDKFDYDKALNFLHENGVLNKDYKYQDKNYINKCVEKFLTGGGRINTEHRWFNLREEVIK